MGGTIVEQIDWDKTLTLLSPHSYALLSTLEIGGRSNLMGISWWTIVSWSPPKLVISVGNDKFSRQCLQEVPEFVLIFPGADQAKGAWLCGSVSGREGDKFQMAGFKAIPATKVRPLMVEGATVCLECKVVQTLETGDHTLFVADIIATHGSPQKPMHLYSIHYNKLVAIDFNLNATDDLSES